MPLKIASSSRFESLPLRSVSTRLSKETIRETLATESLGRPVCLPLSKTLPGAFAHLRLLVSGIQMIVLI